MTFSHLKNEILLMRQKGYTQKEIEEEIARDPEKADAFITEILNRIGREKYYDKTDEKTQSIRMHERAAGDDDRDPDQNA